MKNWINKSLIMPNSQSYILLSLFNRYFFYFIVILSFTIMSYPLFNYTNATLTISTQQLNLTEMRTNLAQKERLITSLKQHNQKSDQTNYFSQANNNLQTILNTYQIKPEQLQWQLDQEHQLSLIINHNSNTLFHLLNELNKLEHLYAKEITLTKLNQHRLVQLNAQFILVE